MRRTRILGSACSTCAATVAALLLGTLAPAQEVTESALKAAFIYNFAKFTEWPDDLLPAKAPIAICVLGDKAIADALGRAVKDRELGEHPIRVSHVVAAGPLRTCHVLYVSDVPALQTVAVIAGLGDAAVLTISDMEGFTALGGITQLYFDRGRINFTVHLPSAKKARLQISSRILVLAKKP
jgi:YfiR/HmsC-like